MSTPDNAPFRFRGLWQWQPVSCVTPRSYDEAHMQRHNAWFFDRAFMRRYFDAMRAAGLNTWTLANTHPFPFMVDLDDYPEAQVLSPRERARYRAHYHWLFETARGAGIMPFVLFHTCYVPDRFGAHHGIRPGHSFEPPPPARDYTRACVRRLCDTYPELAGIHGEASENVAPALRQVFARDAIVAGIHDSARRPPLFFRGWASDPAAMKRNVLDVYEGECFFTVKYTWEFLVHRRCDPEFRRWVETCGADRVLPEFWISNFQPFGCHDLDLARGIRRELRALGCPGFTSHPMDLYGAPFVQGDGGGVLQLDRDRDWYATLSGVWPKGEPERAAHFGLGASEVLDDPAAAASRPFTRISYYMTGNKQNFLQPQLLASIADTPERCAGLQTPERWRRLPEQVDAAYGRWMDQIDGIATYYPTEARREFGLEELLAELEVIDTAWHEPAAGILRETEAYAAWRRDVVVQHGMARAWARRAGAILARLRGDRDAELDALDESMALVIQAADAAAFAGRYRLLVGRHTLIIRWRDLIAALARERDDVAAGRRQAHYLFGAAEFYHDRGPDAGEA